MRIRYQTFLGVLFFSSSLVMAQSISFGVKGGGFITDPAERYDQGDKYVAGPMVEAGLPWQFAVEGNALYSRFGSTLGSTTSSTGVRGNSWEFPILGKRYFADRRNNIRPFFSGGIELRKIWFDDRTFGRRSGGSSDVGVGGVAGGGIALKFGRFTIAPEFRYTRWGRDSYPATNPNQALVLVGIQF